MSIRYKMVAADIGRVRLSPSPIGEAIFSLRALAQRGASKWLGLFAKHATARLRDVDIRLLSSLIPGTGYVPDVLTPAPQFAATFRSQLEELRATPIEEFAAQVAWMARDPGTTAEWKARTAARRGFVVEHPEQALPVIVQQLEQYWRAVLDPIWAHLVHSIGSDIRDRTIVAERSGVGTMLSSLNERVSWDGSTLSVRSNYDFSTSLGGGGIATVPGIFSQAEVLTMMPPLEPMLVYPRVLNGDFWTTNAEGLNPLINLLGRVRATILHALRTPETTGTLAELAGVTPGAISQQLAVLRESGLVVTIRRGRNSVHALTGAGESLVVASSHPAVSRSMF